ncbi:MULTISPECIES: bifunctional 4-hydroxy-2-oxoglutarate aldolase/2-dehydro-3-deoxy-phosphogluconate aldolase [Mannheimia]|uniref:2-dehydro-3-deoxy-phosphogluconate aldolase n=1 Tax=Mannheimia pernigra TaxID=111844 RepID=A0A7D5IUI5_9PAST|nr:MULTISPECIES: bifunctional 4-hydroxy-2-oxoglutarate aldolase/2-dehydro-3-deoxy-phosphogluconate aldolase [Mannheimia]QLB39798.1 bifunctional 4-hydroxy-2-oxoglutarate aldolase/2-dehydro-3-deoxy-phosphogluconate aldolase [Mannheimia pernigra]QTM01059.1 bifunctional 4-hydroxy-2-oxoglutarate aldolase/2-dehydro-3-deoxy-phosphogluconate aldolase [Mannheimia sp. ZY171111]
MRYTTEQIVEKLRELKVVPVIALDNAEDILPLAKTLSNNGLPVVEITFRSAAAEEAIKLVKANYPEVLIAAGTVLTKEQVLTAKNAGADCIVTPGFNPNIVQYCQDLNLPIIPGVNNPMAIEAALELGIQAVKFFPAEASGGAKMIKALLGPYSNLQMMPTGGISLANIKDYLTISNVLACGGSWFVEQSLIKEQKWEKISELVREVVEIVN